MTSDQRSTLYVAAPVDRDHLVQVMERVRRRAQFAPHLAFPPEVADTALIYLAIFEGRLGDHWEHFTDAYRANQSQGRPFLLCYRLPPPPGADPEELTKLDSLFTRLDDNHHNYQGEGTILSSRNDWENRLEADLIRLAGLHRWTTPQEVPLQEESRRLDVAFSPNGYEFWTQVCIPSSTGFRNNLSNYRKRAPYPHERAGIAPIFLIGEDGTLQPVLIHIEVMGAEPVNTRCLIWSKADSEVLKFTASAEEIHLRIKQTALDGSQLLLGEIRLACSKGEWIVASLPLIALSSPGGTSRYQMIPPGSLGYVHLPGEQEADREDDDL